MSTPLALNRPGGRVVDDLRDRDGLIGRIRQLRRAAAASDVPAEARAVRSETDRFGAFEARLEHLERLVEGLQDSVHRESARHAKWLAELEARLQPSALGKALSEDARARGL